MPAKSKKQQQLMGIVRAIQKGDMKPSEASSKAREMAKSMKPKDVKDFASTEHEDLPKKTKKENLEPESMYLVLNPTPNKPESDLVLQFDPLHGIQPLNINMHDVHTVHHSHKDAQRIAAEVYKNYMEERASLEEKKDVTVNKLKKAIDKLEKKRKEHVNMVKEDPKNASNHREHIAKITTQIDDFLGKMEKIEKSKKDTNKENLNEETYADLSGIGVGQTSKSTDSSFQTTVKDIDPISGKVSWDVKYSVDPKLVYQKLEDLINFIGNKGAKNDELRKIQGILKSLRRQTARLITTQ